MIYEIKYRKEDKMKGSGFEWLGMIPEDWENKKFKYVFNYTKGRNPKEFFDYEKNLIPYVNAEYLRTGITDKYVSSYNGLIKSRSKDILLLWDGANAGEFFEGREGALGSTFARLDLISKENFSYLKHYTNFYEGYLKDSTYGMGIPHVNSQILNNLIFFMPKEIEYQQKIANFLDLKTAEFDSIISKKELLIEKLEEAKKSLISEVVTGKVKIVNGKLVERKANEMKDSGIEWLRMIPKDWEISKIKYISRVNNKTISNNVKKNLEISYIDIASVDNIGNVNNIQELIFEDAPSRARRIVSYEDSIVSTVRTYLKAIAFIDRKFDGFICSTGFAVFTPKKKLINPKYFYYIINSEDYINQIVSRSTGVSYPAINASEIANLNFILPKLREQDLIVQMLEYKLKKLNFIITKTKLQIQKLKQAKQSLISEAVTGKIDLRDWEIQEI